MPKQSLAQKSIYWLKVISLGLILGLGIQFAQAWTSPTAAPPNGNVSGPLTTSGIGQIKQGPLALNTDGVYANALLIPSGNVGIGTVSPVVPLHLFSTNPGGYTEQMLIEGTGNEGGYLRLQGKWPLLRFMSSVAPSGKKGFAFQNDGAGRLVLGTLGDDLGWKDASAARVMSWTSDGNVGIGTVNPTNKLMVQNWTSGPPSTTYVNVYSGGTSSQYGDDAGPAIVSTNNIAFYTGGVGFVPDGSKPTANGASQRMIITPTGNIGIGTVNPTEKLDVNGNVKTTGVLTAGKVRIVDVVAENTDCAPMGLVARDNTGVLLSCQGSPLKWKKASGGSGASCPSSGQQSGRVYVFDNGGSNGPMVRQCLDGVEYNIGSFAPWTGATGGN